MLMIKSTSKQTNPKLMQSKLLSQWLKTPKTSIWIPFLRKSLRWSRMWVLVIMVIQCRNEAKRILSFCGRDIVIDWKPLARSVLLDAGSIMRRLKDQRQWLQLQDPNQERNYGKWLPLTDLKSTCKSKEVTVWWTITSTNCFKSQFTIPKLFKTLTCVKKQLAGLSHWFRFALNGEKLALSLRSLFWVIFSRQRSLLHPLPNQR